MYHFFVYSVANVLSLQKSILCSPFHHSFKPFARLFLASCYFHFRLLITNFLFIMPIKVWQFSMVDSIFRNLEFNFLDRGNKYTSRIEVEQLSESQKKSMEWWKSCVPCGNKANVWHLLYFSRNTQTVNQHVTRSIGCHKGFSGSNWLFVLRHMKMPLDVKINSQQYQFTEIKSFG